MPTRMHNPNIIFAMATISCVDQAHRSVASASILFRRYSQTITETKSNLAMDVTRRTKERLFISFDRPDVGCIALHFSLTAFGAKLNPLTTTQAKIDVKTSNARIGLITNIESTTLALMNLIKALESAKTPTSPERPSLIFTVNHSNRLGASTASIATSTISVTTDASSWLCGTCPCCLAFSNLLGVGCSVFSAAGFSGMFYPYSSTARHC